MPSNGPSRLPLYAAGLSLVVVWWLMPLEVSSSDQWQYAKRAWAIATLGDFGSTDPFGQRLFVTLPTALAYRLFGVSVQSTNLWPLLCCLGLMVVVWSALPRYGQARTWGMVACSLCGGLWYGAAHLFPDIVAAALGGAGFSAFLQARTNSDRPSSQLALLGILTGAALFLALLAKLTAYWFVLGIGYIGVLRDKDYRDRALFTRFYAPAIATASILLVGYLLFCKLIWGDALSRLHAVEGAAEQHLWTTSGGDLVQRVTIEPIGFLLTQFGVLPLLLWRPRRFGISDGPGRDWLTLLVIGCACFWFMPTSLGGPYTPLPPYTRMIAPLLAPSLILTGLIVAGVANSGGPRRALRAALVLALINGPQFANKASKLVRQDTSEQAAVQALKQHLATSCGRQHLVLTAEPRSAEYLAFYFGFEYPAGLSAQALASYIPSSVEDRHVVIFCNESRLRSLRKYYAYTAPDLPLGDTDLFRSATVQLYSLDDFGQLKPAAHMGR